MLHRVFVETRWPPSAAGSQDAALEVATVTAGSLDGGDRKRHRIRGQRGNVHPAGSNGLHIRGADDAQELTQVTLDVVTWTPWASSDEGWSRGGLPTRVRTAVRIRSQPYPAVGRTGIDACRPTFARALADFSSADSRAPPGESVEFFALPGLSERRVWARPLMLLGGVRAGMMLARQMRVPDRGVDFESILYPPRQGERDEVEFARVDCRRADDGAARCTGGLDCRVLVGGGRARPDLGSSAV